MAYSIEVCHPVETLHRLELNARNIATSLSLGSATQDDPRPELDGDSLPCPTHNPFSLFFNNNQHRYVLLEDANPNWLPPSEKEKDLGNARPFCRKSSQEKTTATTLA